MAWLGGEFRDLPEAECQVWLEFADGRRLSECRPTLGC